MNTNKIHGNKPHNLCGKSLTALITVLVAASATISAHAALPIKNGGFETGDLTGWTITPAFDGGVTSAEAYRGSYSLELDAVDVVFQEVTAVKHFSALSFMAKAENPGRTGVALARVYYHDGDYDEVTFGSADLASGDWESIGVSLDSTKRVVLVEIGLGESYPIYIDAVALIP